jgi:hypothetical protein
MSLSLVRHNTVLILPKLSDSKIHAEGQMIMLVTVVQ